MSSKKLKPVKSQENTVTVEPDSLGFELRRARNRAGLSIRALGELVGVSHASISRNETGVTTPDRTTLIRLAQELKDDFGRPELRKYVKESAIRRIPVLAYVAGGRPIVLDIEDEFITVDRDVMKLSGDVCGLRVKGDSMIDQHILSGDTLICRLAGDPRNIRKGTIVVVDLKGERGAAVKRWESKGENIYLYADKHTRDDEKQVFHDWEVGKVFEILGLVRSLK